MNLIQDSFKGTSVDIWVVDLQVKEPTLQRAYDVLSQDESQRSQRFRFAADRRRFVLARAALREVLAQYVKADAKLLQFEYNGYGKPRLAKIQSNIAFNASRSGEKALIACTSGREVGVDVEAMRRDLEIEDLAKRFFTSAENQKLQSFPADQKYEAFFRCWTCKEAFVKAVGQGLSLGLDKFDVSAGIGSGDLGLPLDRFVVDGWSLMPITADSLEGYISAVAMNGEHIEVTVREWDKTR